MSLLEKINTPADLKKLSRKQLPDLAQEIRKVIVEVVSKNGGHLASSLGSVELTIAIHYVFDTPNDKLIWDVGHQAYAHKLLTGRHDQFHSLRQYKGISGFTRMKESPYDTFSAGHSSTSISAGLGIAHAKHLKKEKSKVIAVIGDGSMTAGIAFEGLNQAGGLGKRIIVIINDNMARIDGLQGHQNAQYCCLARSARPDKRQLFTAFGVHVEIVQNLQIAVCLRYLPKFDDFVHCSRTRIICFPPTKRNSRSLQFVI